jgi:hypothetical protein
VGAEVVKKRVRPTVAATRALERKIEQLDEAIRHWQRLYALANGVRLRFQRPIFRELALRNGSDGVIMDEIDHTAVAGPISAMSVGPGGIRYASMDSGDLGRGGGPSYYGFEVDGKQYKAMRG